MDLAEIGEFGLIKRVKRLFARNKEPIVVGIGDDAAAIRFSGGRLLLLTSDLLIEGIHFSLSYSSFFQIGRKALTANISDIAAMGGVPLFTLVSLAIPEGYRVEDIEELYRGMADLSRTIGVSTIGGDTSASKKGFFISLSLIGEVEEDLILKRSGARVGDTIFLTGTMGDSAAGLELLRGGIKTKTRDKKVGYLIRRHLKPNPRLKEGRFIATNQLATSMIDISDGLAIDLSHICEESKVGAEIFEERIPLSDEIKRARVRLKKDPLFYALGGGEDYELLFTVDKKRTEEVMNLCKKGGLTVSYIGNIIPPKNGMSIIGANGKKRKLKATGYEHFRKT